MDTVIDLNFTLNLVNVGPKLAVTQKQAWICVEGYAIHFRFLRHFGFKKHHNLDFDLGSQFLAKISIYIFKFVGSKQDCHLPIYSSSLFWTI